MSSLKLHCSPSSVINVFLKGEVQQFYIKVNLLPMLMTAQPVKTSCRMSPTGLHYRKCSIQCFAGTQLFFFLNPLLHSFYLLKLSRL